MKNIALHAWTAEHQALANRDPDAAPIPNGENLVRVFQYLRERGYVQPEDASTVLRGLYEAGTEAPSPPALQGLLARVLRDKAGIKDPEVSRRLVANAGTWLAGAAAPGGGQGGGRCGGRL